MKKTTTKKSTKSTAPATKPIPTAKSIQPAKPTAKTKAVVPPPPPVVKSVAPTRLATKITALIDVGFGNTLYIRGDGPGLSWEKGVPLGSEGHDKWSISLGESGRPVLFKFLINDVSWSAGEDYTVAPGTSITITPVF